MRHSASLAALTLSTLSALCVAQPSTPTSSRDEEIRRMMESTSNSVLPSVARTVDAVLDAELKFAERPDAAVRIAAFKRNLYDALIKRGFTADQAIQIVLNTPLPSTATAAR